MVLSYVSISIEIEKNIEKKLPLLKYAFCAFKNLIYDSMNEVKISRFLFCGTTFISLRGGQ